MVAGPNGSEKTMFARAYQVSERSRRDRWMTQARRKLNGDVHEEFNAVQRIGNWAVVQAQEESRRLGVPNVYSHRGRVYYELPSGELSLADPLAPQAGEA